MQISIEAQPIGALRVLPLLPDAQLAVLEGLNGIGKTLTVRLLQICTGTMPYRVGSPAWPSLCRGLGEFTIRITGISGANTIEWTADTREWLNYDDVATLPFKRVAVDGSACRLSDVRRLLIVHRLAGDETLIETLAQQAENGEGAVRRWARIARETTNSPIGRLESAATDALRMLGEWTGSRYASLGEEIKKSEAHVLSLNGELLAAAERKSKLTKVVELRRDVERYRSIAPDLRSRIQTVDDEIVTARQELERTQSRLIRLAEHAARTEPAIRELQNAERTLRRNQDKLTRAIGSVATAAAALGIAPSRQAVNDEMHALRGKIQALSTKQLSMDSAPAMRLLLDGASSIFAGGELRGLGDQVAFDDPETDLQLTVRNIRAGFSNRRNQLEGQPPPPEALAVLEQLRSMQTRLVQVERLAEQLTSVERYRRLALANESRVDRALAIANPSANAQLQVLQRQRRQLDATILDLAGERAALRQQLGDLGGEPLGVLQARLQVLMSETNVAQEDLAAVVESATSNEQSARVASAQAEQVLADLRRDVARAEADVRRTIRSLARSGELGWLGSEIVGQLEITSGSDLTQQLAALDRLRAQLESAAERIGTHRVQLAAVEAALRGVGRHLRGLDAEATEYVPQLEKWFSRKFGEWFNSDKIRAELLPEADGPITVDVREREVRWSEGLRERSRPLEAFSSGEQAFAYTRARLAQLDEEVAAAPNRLIVLDEFGAFIAHDRLSGLLSYLKRRVQKYETDQVLVILPLSHDYASEAENSIGTQKEQFERFARQVAADRFLVRVLTQ
jgi:chromosome segregation ATPase